jgi:hypothetical protein
LRVVGILVRRSNDRLGSRQKLKLSPLALGCSPCQRSSLHWPRLLPSHKLEENEPCQSPLFIHARALKFFEWLHKLHSLSNQRGQSMADQYHYSTLQLHVSPPPPPQSYRHHLANTNIGHRHARSCAAPTPPDHIHPVHTFIQELRAFGLVAP